MPQLLRILLCFPGSSKLGLGSRVTSILLQSGTDVAPSMCHPPGLSELVDGTEPQSALYSKNIEARG